MNKSSLWSGHDLNSGASELQVRRSNCSTTLPPDSYSRLFHARDHHGYSKVADNKEERGEAKTSVIKEANSHISLTL